MTRPSQWTHTPTRREWWHFALSYQWFCFLAATLIFAAPAGAIARAHTSNRQTIGIVVVVAAAVSNLLVRLMSLAVQDTSTMILLLRPFAPARARQTRLLLAPCLAVHGRVVTLDDPAYSKTRTSSEYDALGANILGTVAATEDDWKDKVKSALERCTAVVFDVSDVTRNISWEMREARERCGESRLVFVSGGNTPNELPRVLHYGYFNLRFRYALFRALVDARRQVCGGVTVVKAKEEEPHAHGADSKADCSRRGGRTVDTSAARRS